MAAATAGRRVVTEPPILQRRLTELLEEQTGTDLYVVENAKVFSFGVPSSLSSPLSSKNKGAVTLPWKLKSGEDAVLRGRLRIYHTPSETLRIGDEKWGTILLPATKCWCVDGDSTFAMRKREEVYRIELPDQTENDKRKVEEFKSLLREHIRYEKDPCPFRKGSAGEAFVDESDTPKTKNRMIGTKRPQLNPFGTVKLRPAKGSPVAQHEESPDVSDDDPGARTPPVTSPEKPVPEPIATAPEPSPDATKTPIRPREALNTTRSFTAPITRRIVDPDSPPSSSSSHDSAEKISDEVDPDPASPGQPQHELNPEAIETDPISPMDTTASPNTLNPSSSNESSEPTLPEPLRHTTSPPSPAKRLLTDISGIEVGTKAPVDPPTTSSSMAFVSQLPASDTAFSVSASGRASPAPSPSLTPIRPITPPRQRQSSTSTTASRIPGTPPLQPSPKARPTIRTSTSAITTPRFRHSSLVSEDDIPSLGVFSQTLNVLLGPPSGLLAVLVGAARKVGSFSRRASTSTRGLSLGFNGFASNEDARPTSSGMPGSWDSEDEGETAISSDASDSLKAQSSAPGLKKKHSWASASDRATGRNSDAMPQQGLKPDSNHEWTDDDLD